MQVTKMIALTAMIAVTAFVNPHVSVTEAPIASRARKETEAIAVLATRNADHRRARSAVKRSA